MNRRYTTANLTYASLLTALAIILSYFPEIPLAFFAPWLKLDFSFTPLLILGFSLGPVMAGISLVITNVVHILGGTTSGVGELANIIVGLAFLMPPTIMYRRIHTWRGAIIGMVIGVVLMALAGIVSNRYLLLPTYFGSDYEAVLANMGLTVNGYLWAAILPFNLTKGVANALLTQLLYKRLSGVLKEAQRDVTVQNNNKK
ncbi:MAG: ECF transporter S component [Eubacteriales bacterium]|nr:ECF transporter S component [Eubacteriales bacterium]